MDRLRRSQDFWAGLLFLLSGLGAMLAARAYPMGTAQNMGSGYFPLVLGGVLALLGALITARALRRPGEPVRPVRPRHLLFVLAAILAFAGLVEYAGLIAAAVMVVLIGVLARAGARPSEALLLAVLLTALAALIFKVGLGLPLALWGY